MDNLFPKLFDSVMQPFEISKLYNIRRELLSQLTGNVLEIGSGTGANFPFYKKGVTVEAIEPNSKMISKSDKKRRAALVPITVHEKKAETLPFSSHIFDSVVATLVFCTIEQPELALAEIQRVTKPGAKVVFFEHVRMPQPLLASLQDFLTPVWGRCADGCQLNRDTLNLIKEAGFDIDYVKSYGKGLFLEIICYVPS